MKLVFILLCICITLLLVIRLMRHTVEMKKKPVEVEKPVEISNDIPELLKNPNPSTIEHFDRFEMDYLSGATSTEKEELNEV